MESEGKMPTSWEVAARRYEEKESEASAVTPSSEEGPGLAALAGCLHPFVIIALLVLYFIGQGVVTAWDTEIRPALSEFTRVEEANTDPREGEVRVNRRTLKECDGTTLIWTTATSLITSDVKVEPNSPECQSPP